jgi:hypothetical protein
MNSVNFGLFGRIAVLSEPFVADLWMRGMVDLGVSLPIHKAQGSCLGSGCSIRLTGSLRRGNRVEPFVLGDLCPHLGRQPEFPNLVGALPSIANFKPQLAWKSIRQWLEKMQLILAA